MDLKKIYLAAPGLRCSTADLHRGMWDLVPWLLIEPGPSALGAQGVNKDHQGSP